VLSWVDRFIFISLFDQICLLVIKLLRESVIFPVGESITFVQSKKSRFQPFAELFWRKYVCFSNPVYATSVLRLHTHSHGIQLSQFQATYSRGDFINTLRAYFSYKYVFHIISVLTFAFEGNLQKDACKMLVKLPSIVNFSNNLQAAFSYISVLRSFSLFTNCLAFFGCWRIADNVNCML